MIVVGLLLFVIGAAGGWPNPLLKIDELSWRIALAVMGVVTAGIGGLLLWRERSSQTNDLDFQQDFGVKITSPSRSRHNRK